MIVAADTSTHRYEWSAVLGFASHWMNESIALHSPPPSFWTDVDLGRYQTYGLLIHFITVLVYRVDE